MALTFGRKRPRKSPPGDYATYCDYCGSKYYRSELRMDRSGRLFCPQEGFGKDAVTLSMENAALAQRLAGLSRSRPRGGATYNIGELAATYYRDLDTSDPELQSLSPSDGGQTSVIGSILEMTFNKPMQRGGGAIELYKSDDTLVQTFADNDIEFAGWRVRLSVDTTLEEFEGYYVLLAEGALQDLNQVSWEGISDATTWNFTASFVESFDPEDGETGVSTGTQLTIDFYENVEAA